MPFAVINNFVAPMRRPRAGRSRSRTSSPWATSSRSRTTATCWRSWPRPTGRSAASPWTCSARGRYGRTSNTAHALGLDGQVRFLGFRPDVRDLLPATGLTSTLPTRSHRPWRSSRRWRRPSHRGRRIGPISELCDDGVEGRFWPLDDPARAANTLMDLLDSEPARLRAARRRALGTAGISTRTASRPRLLSFLMDQPAEPESPGR